MAMRAVLVMVILVLAAPTVTFAQGEGAETATGVIVVAQVIWPGQDLTNASFRVFSDPQLKSLVDVFPSGGPGGAGVMALRPGEYYIMAVVDVDGSGKLDKGDGVAWYGVEDLAPSSRPQKLVVGDEVATAVVVPVLMTIGEDGRLTPLPDAPPGDGGVCGKVTGADGVASFVMAWQGPEARRGYAALVVGDGSFEIEAEAGQYGLYWYGSLVDAQGQAQPPAWRTLRSATAQPVAIAADQVTDVGELAAEQATTEVPEGMPALAVGTVIGPKVPEGSHVFVQLCADERMTGVVAEFRASESGLFVAAIESAVYYARAVTGQDAAPSPGDLLGFYGVADLLGGERPQALQLSSGAVRADVTITLTARLNDQMGLEVINAADDAAGTEAGE